MLDRGGDTGSAESKSGAARVGTWESPNLLFLSGRKSPNHQERRQKVSLTYGSLQFQIFNFFKTSHFCV
jgi:hypothetical protein